MRETGGGEGRARRLVVAAVAVALALGAAGAVLALRGYDSATDAESRRVSASASASVADIAQFVRARTQILEGLTSSDSFLAAEPGLVERRLSRLSAADLGFAGGLAWFDADGRVRAENGSGLLVGDVAGGDLGAVLGEARAAGASRLSPAIASSIYPTPVVAVVTPTRGRDGQVNGTLVGALSVAWLNGFARTRQELRGGDALIVDRRGTLFVAPGLVRPREILGDPTLERARRQGADTSEARVESGTRNVLGQSDRLTAYATDREVTGWTVFVDRSTASAYADARQTLWIELSALALLVALGIAGAILLGRRVEREQRVVAAAESRARRLQEMAAALSAAPTPERVADAVLSLGQEATGAAAGSIALLDREGKELVTLGLVGYSDEVAETFTSYPANAPLPTPDSLRRGPIWLHDAAEVRERYPHLSRFHATMSHEAVVALPLAVEGKAIGGLALSFPGSRVFDADERAFLLTVADLCAQALERSRLYEFQRRDAERERFLADASTLLATPLEPRIALSSLARMAVPGLADWCSVSLATDSGVEMVAVTHTDPERAALARDIARRFPPSDRDASGVGAVIRTGRSEFVPQVTPEVIEAALPPGEQRDAVLELGLVAAMTVPLTARGRTLGALVLASGDSGRRFHDEDLQFAEDLGRRAGLAIDNALLFSRSRQIARTLQDSLLPTSLPDIAGLDVAARYVAGGEGVDVGGDFYDLFALEDERAWFAVLGDVCGKGPEAAALTALARYTIRADAEGRAPGEVLQRLNRAVLAQVGDLRFLTATCALLRAENGHVEGLLARGGHPPSLILRADGAVEIVVPTGPLIGVLPTTHFEERAFRLSAGDVLVLFSDGVTEARSPDGELFGVERLRAVLSPRAGAGADEIARAVDEAVMAFGTGRPRDDVALLVLRAVPTP